MTDRSTVNGHDAVAAGPGASPGSAGRAAAGAVNIGSAVGAVVTGCRVLGPAEARPAASSALLVLVEVIGAI